MNIKGSKLLGDIFVKQISSVFNGQANYSSSLSLEERRSQVTNIMKTNDCITVLKSIHSDNLNKLILTLFKKNSIKNKLEFLSTQIKSNIDVLKVHSQV